MPKKVVIIDAEDFRAIDICLSNIEVDLDRIPDSHFKNEVERRIKQIRQILSEED